MWWVYVKYGKLYREIFYFVYEKWWYVIVYDKYRHCIWMLFIHQNLAYKECPYAIVYNNILAFFVHKIEKSTIQLAIFDIFDHILCDFLC